MLSEQITVTSTPQTIEALLKIARPNKTIPTRIVGVMLRYGVGSLVTVALTDEHSTNGAVVLDAQGEQLYTTSFRQFDVAKASLVSSGADVVVHIIAEQTLVHGH